MNIKFVVRTLGNILKIEAYLLMLPLIVSIIYKENNYLAFVIPIVLLYVIGYLMSMSKSTSERIYTKEGLVIVGLSWILVSAFGALPFIISQEIPNIVNALFETISGFTTTGASILESVEEMPKGLLFWRSFTHWIGGMGILVFILAILPQGSSRNFYVMKAEVPGPQVGKIVSKVKRTARILYGIYVLLSLIEVLLLWYKIPLYDSLIHTFGTAGTGGFSSMNQSVGAYGSVYVDVVITVFMFLFGSNFFLFYLLLIGHIKDVKKNEEFRWYFLIVLTAIVLLSINTLEIYGDIWQSIRYSSFQVVSIMTTTGYSTYNFNFWPNFSKAILVILMFIGASAGSTGGGIKVSRVILYIKKIFRGVRYSSQPRKIETIRLDGKPVNEMVIESLSTYLITYLAVFVIGILLVSIQGLDLITSFSAVAATLNNIGPGLSIVGPSGNYLILNDLSKVTLMFMMLIGRLEIFPILILFSVHTWRR